MQVDLRHANSWTLGLQEVPLSELLQTLTVNSVAPFLLISRLMPLLQRSPSARKFIVNVSAMEGQFGRVSKGCKHPHTNMAKAALNMLIKTAAIEVKRSQPNAVLLALHPGTVNSRLSQPFRGSEIGRPASEAADDLLRVIDGLGPEASGGFYAYSGEALPW